jgi:hypothetical protein
MPAFFGCLERLLGITPDEKIYLRTDALLFEA